MSRGPRFRFVERTTSDIAFRAWGATLAEVLHAAAQALLAATVERPKSVKPRVTRTLEIRDEDVELLLLRFLNELIYLRDAEGLVLRPRAVQAQPEGPFELRAVLEGEPLDPQRHGRRSDVKAATAHGLRLAPTDTGWEAEVTLDV